MNTTTTTVADWVTEAAPTAWGDTFWAVIAVPVALALVGWLWSLARAAVERRRSLQEARRTENKELFTAALDAVHEYQELPYRIRRRSTTPPMTAAELTARASDVQVLLDKYITRLHLEDQGVGEAYQALVSAARKEAGGHMTAAWKERLITADAEMSLGNAYPRVEAEKAKGRCIALMQGHLDPDRQSWFRRDRT